MEESTDDEFSRLLTIFKFSRCCWFLVLSLIDENEKLKLIYVNSKYIKWRWSWDMTQKEKIDL